MSPSGNMGTPASIEPFNLATGKYGPVYVGLSPTEAVRAAHAQSLGDWNTWGYENYPVYIGNGVVTCGDWTARLDNV